MSKFSLAIPFILKHEGGYASSPAGEVVNRGINTDTLRAIGRNGTPDELKAIIKAMTQEEAEAIYQQVYWSPFLDQITSQPVANKILDMSVLSGKGGAVRILQSAVELPQDGRWSQALVDRVNGQTEEVIMSSLTSRWMASLAKIADTKAAAASTTELATYWGKVKIGWMKRAAWNGR